MSEPSLTEALQPRCESCGEPAVMWVSREVGNRGSSIGPRSWRCALHSPDYAETVRVDHLSAALAAAEARVAAMTEVVNAARHVQLQHFAPRGRTNKAAWSALHAALRALDRLTLPAPGPG